MTHPARARLYFEAFSKERGRNEMTAKELETQKFWDELPEKALSPAVLSRWERLATAACEVIWKEEDLDAAEAAVAMAAEDEARMTRISEERDVAEGRAKAKPKGQLLSFGIAAAVRQGPRAGLGACGPMPGASPKPLRKFKGKALGYFTVDNPVRRFCFAVVDDKQFEYVIMSFIIISSFTMVFESPRAMAGGVSCCEPGSGIIRVTGKL